MGVNNPDKMIIEYTPNQQMEIDEGIAAKVDTSWYENPKFLAIQMRQIRLGLISGIDVSVYADISYDWFQMMEIRVGLEKGIDISKYADPSIDYIKMRQVRKGLEEGIDVSKYIRYDAGILREIRRAKSAHIDIIPYVKEKYDAEQLEQIRISMEHNVNLLPFMNKEYRGVSLEEIRVGLEKGLDVSAYARLEYNWKQMREIRLGLESRVAVSEYDNPFYTYRQMREIRKGLECGLPVQEYSKMRFSATDMQKKRLKLQENLRNAERNVLPTLARLEDAFNEGEDREHLPFKILISPDDMEVHLLIVDKDVKFTEDSVLRELWMNKVRKGILRKEIRKAADGVYNERSVLVACGQAPRSGRDGYYEYFFRTDITKKPKMLEDGSVDYQNIEWFDMVKCGDKLAVYHPAEEGTNGYNIKGDVLKAIKGKEQNVLVGSGFKLEQDQRTYTSTVDGWVELQGRRLEVSNTLVVDDTTIATGNIVFNGSVHVKGNVGSLTEIRASGDVVVDGFVEDATIESGRNVILRRGMNGTRGRGCVIAENNVTGKFLENVKVRAGGNVQMNYCLNCDIEAGNYIEVSRSTGSLVGGRTCAVRGITAQNVGNRAGVNTYIRVGINDDILARERKVSDEIRYVQEELDILMNARRDYESKYPPEVYTTLELYIKLENAIYTKEKQKKELMEEKAALDDEVKIISAAKVVIRGCMYEGTIIEINGNRYLSRNMRNVTIRKTIDENIAVYCN